MVLLVFLTLIKLWYNFVKHFRLFPTVFLRGDIVHEKKFGDETVYVPSEGLTPPEWLALTVQKKWMNVLGSIVLTVGVVLLVAIGWQFVDSGAVLLIFGLAAWYVLCIFVWRRLHKKFATMRRDPRFRFPEMQDVTPSFMVMNVYLALRPLPSEDSSYARIIDSWLVQQWPSDKHAVQLLHYDELATSNLRMWEALVSRMTTFKFLNLHFSDDLYEEFDEACSRLVDEYRSMAEVVLRADIRDEEKRHTERMTGLNNNLERVQAKKH